MRFLFVLNDYILGKTPGSLEWSLTFLSAPSHDRFVLNTNIMGPGLKQIYGSERDPTSNK
ncbi:hypothetical protein BpHYR1_005749 [Brachionus plicatilis]|uniref:Uncharacterized protein n=1 Tax=Brachionus plicatilis TaxID=10195 RepID=A0A3M7S1P2_BRAPC|nr:hypothetical protein BpHYR1_005749 [Brachionus plicatilis]